MSMEGSLAKYKALIKYANCSLEETIEIEAESRSKAEEKCLDIKEQNRLLLERCSRRGIFVSKEIGECVLCRTDMKDELRVCSEVLGLLLKDDV